MLLIGKGLKVLVLKTMNGWYPTCMSTHRFKKGGCGFEEVFAERRDTIRRKVRKPLRLLNRLKSIFVSKGRDYSNLLQFLVLCC